MNALQTALFNCTTAYSTISRDAVDCGSNERALIRMKDALLTFSGSVQRDPAIELWLDERASDLGTIARRWFTRMRECGADVRELVHDGCPVACVDDAPFAYVNVFKAHVNVGFYLGSFLRDPAGLLEGDGKRMRHVKVRPGSEPDPAEMSALIERAYQEIKGRLV